MSLGAVHARIDGLTAHVGQKLRLATVVFYLYRSNVHLSLFHLRSSVYCCFAVSLHAGTLSHFGACQWDSCFDL